MPASLTIISIVSVVFLYALLLSDWAVRRRRR